MSVEEIEVTWKHIDNGVPASCTRCPIALAARDKFGEDHIYVGAKRISFNHRELLMNRESQQFILDFDGGQAIEPFTVKAQEVCV